jgi:hypothetical protein
MLVVVDFLGGPFLILVQINPRLKRRHSGLEAITFAITCQNTKILIYLLDVHNFTKPNVLFK